MKIKWKVIPAAVMAATMTVSAAAAALDGYDINDEKGTMTLYGTVEGMSRYDPIALELVRQGKTIADKNYTGAELVENFLLFTQVPADADGGYRITVDMNGCDAGYYTLLVNGEEPEKRVFFAPLEAKQELADEFVALGKRSDTTAALSELTAALDLKNPESRTVNMLNLTDKAVFEVSDTALSGILMLMLRKADSMTPSELTGAINLSAYIRGLDEGCVKLADCADSFDLDGKYTAAYEERLSAEQKAAFSSKYYRGKGYTTVEGVQTAYKNAVLDSLYGGFKGWADVEYLFDNFGSDCGVNMTVYNSTAMTTSKKNSLYESVMSAGGFANPAAFASFVNSRMSELTAVVVQPPVTPGGGGGGGSRPVGGSSGGGMGQPVQTEVTPIPPAEEKAAEPMFTDMGGFEWAVESVEALAGLGIVQGTGNGAFEPDRIVTREELLAMLMRAFEISTDAAATSGFADVVEDDWFAEYVNTAKSLGLINGISDTEFGAGSPVTREDAAVMCYRIAVSRGKIFKSGAETEYFNDNTEISDYASEAVYALKSSSVLSGRENGMFCPQDSCNRAEAAKIIDTLIRMRGE